MHGYNNSLRLKLLSCLKSLEQTESKCIVIATTQNPEFITRMKLMDTFNESILLPLVSLELSSVASLQTCTLLTTICHSLGYDVRALPPSMSSTEPARKIELSIRDLLYQIKKYHFENGVKDPFYVEQFFNFIQPPAKRDRLATSRIHQDTLFNQIACSADADEEIKLRF